MAKEVYEETHMVHAPANLVTETGKCLRRRNFTSDRDTSPVSVPGKQSETETWVQGVSEAGLGRGEAGL